MYLFVKDTTQQDNYAPHHGLHLPVGYFPWAYTGHSVVYAPHPTPAAVPHPLTAYNATRSKKRRAECQSLLAAKALSTRAFTAPAVDKVTRGVKKYLDYLVERDETNKIKILKDTQHYYFTNGKMGFGRINEENPKSMAIETKWREFINTLQNGRLDQVMSIHDTIGRKILNSDRYPPLSYGKGAGANGGFANMGALEFQAVQRRYAAWAPRVREDWFDNRRERGRRNIDRALVPPPTNLAGVLPRDEGHILPTVAIERGRTMDAVAQAGVNGNQAAQAFYDEVDQNNLLFAGAISGTTGTLLQAAHAFGNIKETDTEHLKQYTLAIVAYLVGGGMHSYHECMEIARRIGVPYTLGTYANSMPATVVGTEWYRNWRAWFYDIVILGDLHGRYVN
ncbi:MAG: hypothetical protein AAGI50_16475 [Pseudomonadota bacterium]